jgi:predicted methyltransferase
MRPLRFDETRVLSQMLNTTDPWQVAGRVRLEFPRVLRTLKRLERKGLIETGPGRVELTAKGRKAAQGIGLRSSRQITAAMKRARGRFASIMALRPSSISLYDQGHMTPDSVFRRAELMTNLGDLDTRRIAILGDDDLLSIAICLCARPESVTILEIDSRIVEFILDVARRLDLPITTECFDLREPSPAKFKGRFDTFVTDPAETMAGLKMFVGRGLYMLKSGEGRAAYFGLTSIEASPRKWSRFQGWLLRNYALAITHALPQYAYYQNWPDLLEQSACFSLDCISRRPKEDWFSSTLIRLETVQGFKPKTMGRVRGPIFNDDEACGVIGGDGT